MNSETPRIPLQDVHQHSGARIDGPSIAELAKLARAREPDPDELIAVQEQLAGREQTPFLPMHGVDPDDLAQTGWALIVPAGSAGGERLDALAPLLTRRREQASAQRERFRVLEFRPGESKNDFLDRHQVGRGAVDPDKLPYYLAIVGSPGEISFELQHQLDIHYAVGRIDFDDVHGYRAYADAVVAHETAPRRAALRAAFVGVNNPDDQGTRASIEYLVEPLADAMSAMARAEPARLEVERFFENRATRTSLMQLIERVPALLFAAGHGFACDRASPEQRALQGALVCQDWPGPKNGPVEREHLLAGEDIARDADLRGMIGLFMSCFGAGTPEHSQYSAFDRITGMSAPGRLAEHPFTAQLPQRLLEQGALAVVSHVERAWDRSFRWRDIDGVAFTQRQTFQSTVHALLEGKRVGFAMEPCNLLYAELAADLLAWQIALSNPLAARHTDEEWAFRQLCAWDARSYVILGDPAVRL
jgi:hypothetical protein